MEDALLHGVFGVDKTYRSKGSTVVEGGAVRVALEPTPPLFVCPDCRSKDVIRRGRRVRRVQSLPIGFQPVFFDVEVPRCECKQCGSLFEIAPPFARPTSATPTP